MLSRPGVESTAPRGEVQPFYRGTPTPANAQRGWEQHFIEISHSPMLIGQGLRTPKVSTRSKHGESGGAVFCGRGVLALAAASPCTDAVASPCADNPNSWTLAGGRPTTCLTKAARSAQTRRTVLDAAQELFAEDGYAATSTATIMHWAGVPS